MNVESMFTPGAAIFTAGPKLLKNANVSSGTVAFSPREYKIGSSGATHTITVTNRRDRHNVRIINWGGSRCIFSVIPSGNNLGDACFDCCIYDIIERGRFRALDTNVKNVYPSDVYRLVFDCITIEVNKYLT